MQIDVSKIVEENKKRLSVLNSPYNPYSGSEGVLERDKLILDDVGEFLLPKRFFESPLGEEFYKAGSLEQFIKNHPEIPNKEVAIELFIQERVRHDFEFWCAYAIVIQDKETKQEVSFVLRPAQRKLLKVLLELFYAGIPIRAIIVKARQWGGSTLVQFFMMWIQQIHNRNWHLAVVAQDDGAASNVSEMMKNAAESYPAELGGEIKFKAYARSPKNSIDIKRGGIIGIGSINNPKQFRSYSYAMIHATEVCEWEDTPKRSAKDLVASLRSILTEQPHVVDITESTAKGVGNFFHKEWQDAVSKKSKYKPVFVSWFEIEIYQRKLTCSYQEFIKSFEEYDWYLWKLGATLEGINWYRETKREKNFDDWQMMQEYPSTANEAFQSSGQRVFPQKYVLNARNTCKTPAFIGQLHSKSQKGKESLIDIEFVQNPHGNLSVWTKPEPIIVIGDKKYKMKDRFCGFADIGGTSKGADFSELTVVDRYWMCPEVNGGLPGLPEIAAQWHGHCFVPKTKIYTSNGFKEIQNVNIGDYVWTHNNRFKKVIRVFKRGYNGELITMRSQGNYETVKCTPEHPFLSNDIDFIKRKRRKIYNGIKCFSYSKTEKIGKSKWVKANELKNISYSKCKTKQKRTPFIIEQYNGGKAKNTNRKIDNLKSLFLILGFYLSEGHISKRRDDNKPDRIVFSFGIHERFTYVQECYDNLIKLGFNPKIKETPEKSVCRVIVCDTYFSRLVLQLCGEHSWEKMLNPQILEYSKELLSILINGVWKGDGTSYTTDNTLSNSITTVSPILARQLRDILILLGYRPGVFKVDTSKSRSKLVKSSRDRYNIVWTTSKQKKHKHLQNSRYITYKLKEKNKEHYNGPVYNLEVEDDNSYSTESYIVHNCDQDLFAWECAKIGTWYNDMLLAIETNSLKKQETEGDHFYTVLDEIANDYFNLFIRNNTEAINAEIMPKYGFQTNVSSKGMIIDNMKALLRETGYVERDTRACDQFDTYETKPNGSLGAVNGEKDDMVITRSGALWLATKYMPLPRLVEIVDKPHKVHSAKRKTSITTF